ncbi:hypothetical protein EAH79_03330 [Sphingomonas koreensis]|nr:hypothetical protein EAH79_03330 [Sphingomonas koreensis]
MVRSASPRARRVVAAPPNAPAGAIVELAPDALRPGALADLFRAGAAVVIIPFGGRLQRLWNQLVENADEQLPWQAPLIDIGRNHHGSTDLVASLGDVSYFQPGQHGYIARKIEIDRDADGFPQPDPPRFHQGESAYEVPIDAMAECCAIADLIMIGLTPPDAAPARYRVAIQRLKYQADLATLQRIEAMMLNSIARWSRVGFRVDANRGTINPRFAGKGVSDALAVMMLSARLRSVATWINRRFGDPQLAQPTGPGRRIVESAHLDERYFSALCGKRETVCTEVFHKDAWHKLPIGTDSVAVFAGKLAQRAYGIPPLLHRVIYTGEVAERPVDPRSGNVTMLIGTA